LAIAHTAAIAVEVFVVFGFFFLVLFFVVFAAEALIDQV
jgi:hypothetical protein